MLKIADFEDMYGIDVNSLRVQIRNGKLPKSLFIKRGYVDDDWFLRRIEFRKRVINYIHDCYYFLNAFFNDDKIAKIIYKGTNKKFTLGTIKNFIYVDMFMIKSDRITNYKLTIREWEVFKFCRKIELLIKRYYPKFNFNDILDKRTNI